jgi:hypothetical protein
VAIVLFLVLFTIGAVVVQWIIRKAVFDGMKDFERWKRKQYSGSDDQGGQQP